MEKMSLKISSKVGRDDETKNANFILLNREILIQAYIIDVKFVTHTQQIIDRQKYFIFPCQAVNELKSLRVNYWNVCGCTLMIEGRLKIKCM